MPGVSTNTIWAPGWLAIPVIRFRVVWGRGETMASFSPTSRFRRVDFPAFGRPTSATNPARNFTSEGGFFSEGAVPSEGGFAPLPLPPPTLDCAGETGP